MRATLEQIEALSAVLDWYIENHLYGEPEKRSIERKLGKMIRHLPKPDFEAYWREAEIAEEIERLDQIWADK